MAKKHSIKDLAALTGKAKAPRRKSKAKDFSPSGTLPAPVKGRADVSLNTHPRDCLASALQEAKLGLALLTREQARYDPEDWRRQYSRLRAALKVLGGNES